tara:strand:- start:3475 stop:4260 length:786 start_codon:yes stop_codon:yes gene_type:complete
MSGNIKISKSDAYKLLNLPQKCTLHDLKKQYKNLVMKYHPDKGGSAYLFDVLNDSFKIVFNDINNKDKSYHELKTGHKQFSKTQSTQVRTTDDSFNEKFNKVFEENKMADPIFDRGYENFIQETDVKTNTKNYELKKYTEPEPQYLSKLNYTELGVGRIKDYSGRNDDKKDLQFMDYKVAHTTGKLIDENQVSIRESYKNIETLKAKRENENFSLNDDEKKLYETMQRRKERKEHKRLNNLKEQEHINQEYDNRMSKVFIS